MKNRVIAGVAALAVVVALVGLAVVAGRGSGSDTPATLPVLGAGGGSGEETAMADSSMRVAGGVRYEVAGKLPGLADEADAWKLPADTAAVERIAELARTLGLDGEVRKGEFGWTVEDGTRRLDVQDVAGNPWSLYDQAPVSSEAEARESTTDPSCAADACDQPMIAPDDPAACAADACDEPMLAPERPADLPSKDEAERIGRDKLTELGVDVANATIRVDDGITIWNVNADPIIGGLPTVGITTSVGIGPKGVISYGNGWLGDPERGDTYPLIGTAAGVEKLDDQQARILMIDPATCEGCPEPEPIVVRVTGVRLGLQLFSTFERGATAYLVPSYLFTTADGGELPVIAVAEEYLGQTPQHPEDLPGTPAEPTDPGTSSGGGSAPGNPGEETCVHKELADASFAQVCAPTKVAVGENVVFRFTAKGKVRDDCGSPVPEFGDESDGVAVCEIGCESLPAEPVEVERTFEHTYAEAGTYTAVIHLYGCGADSGTSQDVSLEVNVTE